MRANLFILQFQSQQQLFCHMSTPARNKLIIHSNSGINDSINLYRGKREIAYSKDSVELEKFTPWNPLL